MQTKKRDTLNLTENQIKVIKDKYLKDAPSIEAWFDTIVNNIALAEVLHHPKVSESEIFKDVNVKKTVFDIYGKKTNLYLLHSGLENLNLRDKNFKKFLKNLEESSLKPEINKDYNEYCDKFYHLLSSFKFLPNSPTLMNAGRQLQQLSACYVLPVEDSIEGIYESVKNMAIIHKSGGGTGFNFSRLRPSSDEVKSTKGVSSGPVSFMGIFDKSTDVVKQGGTRRGANMGIMRYDHPDIDLFIHAKDSNNALENFNISVALDKKFMDAVENNLDFDIVNPRTNLPVGKRSAKALFNELVESAWKSGDPGIIFIDRINDSDSNPTPEVGMIEATNPCGEQPLLPYEPCNLGSINLSKHVDINKKDFDFDLLKETVHLSIRFLDDVIDVNNYPIPKIEELSKSNRRIGLGVMGWAEALVKMEIPYDSEEAFKKAEEVMKFINDESLYYSEILGKERGVFPNFKNSVYDSKGKHFRGVDAKPRHSARTTIAPTGTIGITAGLQGAGIEPFFAVAYTRYNAAGIDALKAGKTPDPKDTFWEVNPLFEKIAQENNYFGLPKEKLYQKISDNHKTLVGINEIPVNIQRLFLTSHDLSPKAHVKMQCAFQKFINNAVSKTVNLKNNATIQDVAHVYELSYKLGAKGVTIYRDGCKQFQVLNLSSKKEDKKESKDDTDKDSHKKIHSHEFNDVKDSRYSNGHEQSTYYEIKTAHGPLHVHINYDAQGPLKVFANISPTGTEISGMTAALGILTSKYLEYGGDPIKLIKHLNSIKGDRSFGFGPKRVDSIPHGISIALRDHLITTGKLAPPQNHGQTVLTPGSNPPIQQQTQKLFCSKCFSTNVEVSSGCSEPTCFDCGYSKCS